jgi:hypothetical protein
MATATVAQIKAAQQAARARVHTPAEEHNPEKEVKCNIRTYVYGDGHEIEFHQICDGVDFGVLSDAFGVSLYGKAELVTVVGTVHWVPKAEQ